MTYAFCESTFDIQILPHAGKILLNIDDFDIISYKVTAYYDPQNDKTNGIVKSRTFYE